MYICIYIYIRIICTYLFMLYVIHLQQIFWSVFIFTSMKISSFLIILPFFFFKDFRADNVLRLYFELVLDFIRFLFTLHIISFINKFLFIHQSATHIYKFLLNTYFAALFHTNLNQCLTTELKSYGLSLHDNHIARYAFIDIQGGDNTFYESSIGQQQEKIFSLLFKTELKKYYLPKFLYYIYVVHQGLQKNVRGCLQVALFLSGVGSIYR